MRRSIAPSWRLWRRLTQLACLLAFLWLFRQTEHTGVDPIPASANLLFRIDPLVAASAMLAAKIVVPSLLIAGILLGLTAVLGRFFCGWVCPLGTLLDGAHRVIPPARPPARSWRRAKYFLLVLILACAVFGFSIVGYFDPFSILVRGLTFAVDPAFAYVVSAPFDWLFKHAGEGVTAVSEPVYTFLKDHILPVRKTTYLLAGASMAILVGIFALERAGRRFWCRNLCPLGALLSLAARPALLRRSPFKSCKGCRQCQETCRMGAFDPDCKMSPEDCNLCMDCTSECPHGMVTFSFKRPKLAPAPFDPSRRLLLGAAGTAVALAAGSSVEGKAIGASRRRAIRPPGAQDEGRFLDLCVRCGECLKVCPTNALQPAGLESGWEGIFSPHMIPRIGYCEYNCTLCGELCPTGAIPRLSEDEKHHAVMGKAEFDKSRCLPYAKGESCIVCEEHCPLPEKAIKAREVEVENQRGEKVRILQPYMKFELCIGCGICENKCPLQGPAGVRVVHVKDAAATPEMAR